MYAERSTIMEECPICQNFMESGTVSCVKGHIICSNCYNKSVKTWCPMCVEEISPFKINQSKQKPPTKQQPAPRKRVKNTTTTATATPRNSCVFHAYGCEVSFEDTTDAVKAARFKPKAVKAAKSVLELQEHEKNCEFRIVACTYKERGCDKIVPHKNLNSHTKTCSFRAERAKVEEFGNFTCYKCSFTLLGQVRFCRGMHAICEVCVSSQELCSCGSQIEPTRIRMVEILLETANTYLWLPCIYKSKGCNENVTLETRDEHSAVCEFRPIRCYFGNEFSKSCSWRGSFRDLFTHLITRHSSETTLLMQDDDNTYKYRRGGQPIANEETNISAFICGDAIFYYLVRDTNTDIQMLLIAQKDVNNPTPYSYTVRLNKGQRVLVEKKRAEKQFVSWDKAISIPKQYFGADANLCLTIAEAK